MKKLSLYLFLLFLSTGLFACQQNSEVKVENPQVNTKILEKTTINPMESDSETLVIKDSVNIKAMESNSETVDIEDTVTIKPMESNSETLVIEDAETIKMIKKAIENAEKQPGIANMAKPQYRINIGEETYLLWSDEEAVTIMNTEDTNTIYSLTGSSIKQVNVLLN